MALPALALAGISALIRKPPSGGRSVLGRAVQGIGRGIGNLFGRNRSNTPVTANAAANQNQKVPALNNVATNPVIASGAGGNAAEIFQAFIPPVQLRPGAQLLQAAINGGTEAVNREIAKDLQNVVAREGTDGTLQTNASPQGQPNYLPWVLGAAGLLLLMRKK